MSETILVTGAGGFIGGHLVGKLLQEGHHVRAVDSKPESHWCQCFSTAENLTMNLEEKTACLAAVESCDQVYNFAADMGGMGFIELNKGFCMLTVLDGKQTRSFMFIDDCLYGTRALMDSDVVHPINIGSPEMVTIDRLVDLVEEIAGITVKRNYKLDAPKGVRGRSSDNTFIKSKLGWEPSSPASHRTRENLRMDLRPNEKRRVGGCRR